MLNKRNIKWGDYFYAIDLENKHNMPHITPETRETHDTHDTHDTLDTQDTLVAQTESWTPVKPSKSIATSNGIKTVITRNLPRDITVEQLRAVFEKYGPIKDIYIPKNMDKSSSYFGTIKGFALIKFLNPLHSTAAYNNEYGKLTIGRNKITVEFAKEDR
jgi:hypothetical protein